MASNIPVRSGKSLFVHMHGVLLRQLDLAIVLSVLIYDFLASREDQAVL